MIANIVKPGHKTRGVLNYLYGPGRANEHTDPHLVASWDSFAPDPGRDPDATLAQLTAVLDLRVKQAGDKAPKDHVWHCSIRAAPEDRPLSDDEWATIARRVLNATGIAPADDPDACRWVAVRHADDHIHIVATKVRGDLRPPRNWNDYLRADKELAAIEKEYGLRQVLRGDRTAAKRPTRAEQEKAHRTGHQTTARERLRVTVRTAVSVATSPEEFLGILSGTVGVLIEIQRFPSGDIRGYKIAVAGDTNAAGQPIWFSGSKLAPDLSFPQIRERLTATEPQPSGHSRPNPWHQATAAAERIPHHLNHSDDAAAQAHLAAFGEALDALPRLAPKEIQPQLRQAAITFERATRSRIQAGHHHARALRGAVRAMRTEPVTGDGTTLAMFLDVALLAVLAAARWHQLHHHDQQVAAAHQTLRHLQAAYDHAAPALLGALAHRRPPRQTIERSAHQLREAAPTHAQQILDDPAWDALTAALIDAATAGHQPERILQQALAQRNLDDARSSAQILTWRVIRLGQRPAPSARALAAQARSNMSATPQHGHPTAEPRRPHGPNGPSATRSR
ncbi:MULTISPECIES: relaxase/mobilization nuclease domain-containing protein [unclassified Streptomyces]|uniref:relaxase/mobilization nuclease domain-containing protein n=1 Tax=unclassified Streptomyces TaxID=2593676 RepID=UPI002E10B488|nr:MULTISPECIES: mobilization protein [unclassified Streptomyces]WSJ37723.1 relaxase/mobilization nuclease domain-containing protein [Streptomyces sp. NBC_01321]WSP64125.1 relaxase/mobilization nuclease domain-containing protein [Streptomyces sp. NBC_01240]